MAVITSRLQSHRFIIRQEIRSLVRAVEPPPASQAPTPGRSEGPDRKSISRMIDGLEGSGLVRVMQIQVPALAKMVGNMRQASGGKGRG
jgi:hypothetical protein